MWASVEKQTAGVFEDAFLQAIHRDRALQKTVAVMDGNEVQLAQLKEMAENYSKPLVIVLGLILVLDYL